MKNETGLMTNVESTPALGSDWVDAHADYLFNFAIGQVRDANTAEDLVQDTFLAAVKGQNSFGGKSSARTWLVVSRADGKSFGRSGQSLKSQIVSYVENFPGRKSQSFRHPQTRRPRCWSLGRRVASGL